MENNKDLLKLVRDALAKDTKLKGCLDDIYILVNDGVVIMAGSIREGSMKTRADKIVSNVPGVNLFIDDVTIEPVR